MIPVDKAVIIRYEKGDERFEILADPEKAWEIKEKKDITLITSLDDLLASLDIYKDAKKGERASESEVQKHFNSEDKKYIIFKIITEGEMHLTTDQKRRMQEEKRKKIISLIASQAIDPTTNLPHPVSRIERAIEEAGVHIDPLKPPERQVDEIVNKLRPIIPIKIAKARIEVKIPAQYASKVYGYLKQLRPVKTDWLNDGSLDAIIEIPAGMQTEVFDKLNSMTHGNVYSKLIQII